MTNGAPPDPVEAPHLPGREPYWVTVGGGVETDDADLRDAEAARALCHQAHDQLGPIDILVSNAGAYPRRPWTETRPAHWDEATSSPTS
ncbi:SDR family NAD(P)-dependent oxidoreductase [Streptomyces sp. NPDC088719]|uniref:SDR family NAD(P)-dependent oxidoreductase n=1 Tax=Streptomyces sp. NPDC088719 TaxID=3365872 RepID=UPI0037FDC97A